MDFCAGIEFMKLKKIIVLVLVLSLAMCTVSYASDTSDVKNGDITEYTILNEQVNEIEEGVNNLQGSVSLYSDGFTNCQFNMSCYTDHFHIYFSTGYSRKAEKIGMYNFKLQKKVWYGWKTMFSRSELYNTNTTYCSRGYDLDAEHGETYRLTGTHFAIVNGTTKKLSSTSGELKYK